MENISANLPPLPPFSQKNPLQNDCKLFYKRFTNSIRANFADMTELQHFRELKAALLRKFCEANPHWQGGLKDFGVREIARFQEMLQEETGGRVSEKWFYTHLKKDQEKLPRVDVLDLLSQFVGFENWSSFQSAVHGSQSTVYEGRNPNRRKILALGMLVFITLLAALTGLTIGNEKKYEACFVDAMTQQPIEAEIIIEELRKNESPIIFQADENACHTFHISEEKITFAVQTKYYRADTISRILQKKKYSEIIRLQRDDYAWMIHVFSSGKLEDWKKRRSQLDLMIAEDAMIFQVSAESGRAMELFNKSDFITKLTLPVSSLGELEILQTEYDVNGKIKVMRFCQKK